MKLIRISAAAVLLVLASACQAGNPAGPDSLDTRPSTSQLADTTTYVDSGTVHGSGG